MGELLYRVSGTKAVGVMQGDDDSGMGSSRLVFNTHRFVYVLVYWLLVIRATMTVAWAVTG